MIAKHIWQIDPTDGVSESIVAIEASISEAGVITITERWRDKSEIWSDGVMVRIPLRIWIEIVDWAAQTKEMR